MKEDNLSTLTLTPHPKCVGGYRIGKLKNGYIQINLTYKPNWFHRQMMKLCLGFYWYDEK